MKLFLKNIGKIQKATIDLNGITVIAGENDTGKSTIGKTLFAVFNSFYDIESKIKMERDRYIERLIISIFYSGNLSGFNDDFIDSVIDDLDSCNKSDMCEDTIKEIIYKHTSEELYIELKDIIDKTARKFVEVFNMPHSKFIIEILANNLLTEFNYQICNIFSKGESRITLTIKEKDINIEIKEDDFFMLIMNFN